MNRRGVRSRLLGEPPSRDASKADRLRRVRRTGYLVPLPGLLLALGAAFPRSNIGLELAAVLMIFTGQAWNMTFSYYHSLRSIPQDRSPCARSGE